MKLAFSVLLHQNPEVGNCSASFQFLVFLVSGRTKNSLATLHPAASSPSDDLDGANQKPGQNFMFHPGLLFDLDVFNLNSNQYLNTLPPAITCFATGSKVARSPVRRAAVTIMLAMEWV